MSGGSFDYMYSRIEEAYCGHMEDNELDNMIKDLCKVLKALEWWQSCDTSEIDYISAVDKFKGKWFNNNREYRQEESLKENLTKIRDEINKFIGVELKVDK